MSDPREIDFDDAPQDEDAMEGYRRVQEEWEEFLRELTEQTKGTKWGDLWPCGGKKHD